MKVPNRDLLLDIGVLLNRYSAEDWKNLLEALEDDASRERAISLVRALADLSEKGPAPDSVRSAAEARKRPVRSRARNTTDGLALETTLARLPMPHLREFGMKAGIRVSTKDSRERLIKRIISAAPVADASPQESNRRGSNWKRAGSTDYEKWVKIIMGQSK
jgi:hypothetical protein